MAKNQPSVFMIPYDVIYSLCRDYPWLLDMIFLQGTRTSLRMIGIERLPRSVSIRDFDPVMGQYCHLVHVMRRIAATTQCRALPRQLSLCCTRLRQCHAQHDPVAYAGLRQTEQDDSLRGLALVEQFVVQGRSPSSQPLGSYPPQTVNWFTARSINLLLPFLTAVTVLGIRNMDVRLLMETRLGYDISPVPQFPALQRMTLGFFRTSADHLDHFLRTFAPRTLLYLEFDRVSLDGGGWRTFVRLHLSHYTSLQELRIRMHRNVLPDPNGVTFSAIIDATLGNVGQITDCRETPARAQNHIVWRR